MAAAVHSLSSCSALPSKFSSLSISGSSSSSSAIISAPTHLRSLSFSTHLSINVFSRRFLTTSIVQSAIRRSVVCEAATSTKKADSAAKRIRQNEKKAHIQQSPKIINQNSDEEGFRIFGCA